MLKKTTAAIRELVADAILGAIWFVRATIAFVFEFFANQWRQYTAFGQALFLLAVFMTGADAAISYQYGVRQSTTHGYAFAGIAIAFALFPDVAVTEARKKNYGGAAAMALVAIITGGIVGQSHLGYGGSIRMGMVSETTSNVKKASDTDGLAKQAEASLTALRVAHATAVKERDELRKANPWAASTTADALKAEIANAEGDRIFKRSKQCADVTLPDSRTFCDTLKDYRARLGNIEKMNAAADRIDKLGTAIETAEARLAAKTAEAHDAVKPANDIANQAQLGAIVVNWWNGIRGEAALKPTETQQHASNIVISAFNSFGMLLVAASLFVAAGFNRVPGALGFGGGHLAPVGNGKAWDGAPLVAANEPRVVGHASADIQGALAALADRRRVLTDRVIAMRQARVDGALLRRTG